MCSAVDIKCSITALFDSPHMLIAEEEKIIIEETKGDQTIVEEKLVILQFVCTLEKSQL